MTFKRPVLPGQWKYKTLKSDFRYNFTVDWFSANLIEKFFIPCNICEKSQGWLGMKGFNRMGHARGFPCRRCGKKIEEKISPRFFRYGGMKWRILVRVWLRFQDLSQWCTSPKEEDWWVHNFLSFFFAFHLRFLSNINPIWHGLYTNRFDMVRTKWPPARKCLKLSQ